MSRNEEGTKEDADWTGLGFSISFGEATEVPTGPETLDEARELLLRLRRSFGSGCNVYVRPLWDLVNVRTH